MVHKYASNLSHEELNQLPIDHFEGAIYEIHSRAEADIAVKHLRAFSTVGIDTETQPSFSSNVRHPISLLQVATDDECYIFHLLKINFPLCLQDFFCDGSVCKVGLAFHDDIRGLQRYRFFKPKGCVDLQDIAPLYGIEAKGLSILYAICYGKRISKKMRLSNWANENLSNSQRLYAATDAWATLRIYNHLMS